MAQLHENTSLSTTDGASGCLECRWGVGNAVFGVAGEVPSPHVHGSQQTFGFCPDVAAPPDAHSYTRGWLQEAHAR